MFLLLNNPVLHSCPVSPLSLVPDIQIIAKSIHKSKLGLTSRDGRQATWAGHLMVGNIPPVHVSTRPVVAPVAAALQVGGQSITPCSVLEAATIFAPGTWLAKKKGPERERERDRIKAHHAMVAPYWAGQPAERGPSPPPGVRIIKSFLLTSPPAPPGVTIWAIMRLLAAGPESHSI